MDDCLLGIRREQIADLGAVVGNAKAIDPMLPNGLAGCFVVGIVLEVVHNEEIARREAPNASDPRTIGISVIDLINTPVVGRIPGELARIVALVAKRFGALELGRGGGRVPHGVLIRAEIQLVRSSVIACSPLENRREFDTRLAATWIRTVGFDGQRQCRLRNDLLRCGWTFPSQLCYRVVRVLKILHHQGIGISLHKIDCCAVFDGV